MIVTAFLTSVGSMDRSWNVSTRLDAEVPLKYTLRLNRPAWPADTISTKTWFPQMPGLAALTVRMTPGVGVAMSSRARVAVVASVFGIRAMKHCVPPLRKNWLSANGRSDPGEVLKSPYKFLNCCQDVTRVGARGPRLYSAENAGNASPGIAPLLLARGPNCSLTKTPGRP